MVMLEDVKRVALGLIVFLIIVITFNSMFASPECDHMANITATELRDAIDTVAAEDGVKPWDFEGPPEVGDIDYYRSVPIRLCQERIQLTGGSWVATAPRHVIVYEEFPTAKWWYMWDEAYPWGGGAGNAVLAYGAIRVGGVLVTKGLPFVVKRTFRLGKDIIENVISTRVLMRLQKLSDMWDNVLVKLGRKQATKNSEDATFIRKYFPNKGKKNKQLISDLDIRMKNRQMTELEALEDVGVIEQAGKKVADLDDTGKIVGDRYVVAQNYRGAMRAIRTEMTPAERQMFDSTFYIPSRWKKVEKLSQAWRGRKLKVRKFFTDKWNNIKIVNKVKDFKTKLGKGFDKKFNKKAYLRAEDSLNTQTAIRRWVMDDPPAGRRLVEKDWDLYEPYISDAAERRVKNADDMTDAEMFRFFGSYEKNFKAEPDMTFSRATYVSKLDESLEITPADEKLVQFETTNIVSINSKIDLENGILTRQEWTRKSTGELIDGVEYEVILLPEKSRTAIIEDSISSNERALGQTNVFSELAETPITRKDRMLPPAVGRRFDSNLQANLVSDLSKSDAGTAIFTDFTLRKRLTDSRLDELSARYAGLSKAGGRAKERLWRFAFVDFGRAGIGPAARYNPLAQFGHYSNKRRMQKITEVEGGCAEDSICLITGNSPTAYLLNATNEVKIWRDDFDNWDRTPVFVQTAMFQSVPLKNPSFYTVSPCFGFAKIWKHGGTVYVTIEKCDVGDAANYCYADKAYIWGKIDQPKLITYSAIWTGYFAACKIATAPSDVATVGTTTTASTSTCMKVASYSTIATLLINSAGQASLTGEPDRQSNLPQDRNWGYWNFYKAADVCDVIDMIGSFGASKAAKSSAKGAGKGAQEVAQAGAKGANSNFVGDFCMIPEILGDVSLAWPKVTSPIDILGKNKPLDSDTMRENAATCAFEVG